MKKRVTSLLLMSAVLALFAGCAQPAPQVKAPEQLYAAAVRDAMTVEDEEVLPLVTLTAQDKNAHIGEDGKTLLLSWHKYPGSYVEGTETVNVWGEIWTFTDFEILFWYDEYGEGVTDWTLRLQQLIGLPPSSAYTHFSAVWVNIDDVVRPAYETDVVKQMKTAFDSAVDTSYKAWFDGNIVWSYFDSAYPWTRLGYTYDWADNGREYGLTEFLIQKDSPLRVEFTKTTEQFVDWLAEN